MEGSELVTNTCKSMKLKYKKKAGPYQNTPKKKRLRQENSLGELTKSFIEFVKIKGEEIININDIVKKLRVKKRRIYDITNVLEGIGYIRKLQKNQILWVKKDFIFSKDDTEALKEKITRQLLNNPGNPINKELNEKLNELEDLKKENAQLDTYIDKVQADFKDLTEKPENKTFSYVTVDDLKYLSQDDNVNLIAIKAPSGTVIEIPDKESNKEVLQSLDGLDEKSKKELAESLKMEHQMFMESKNGEIGVYLVLARNEYEGNANSNMNSLNNPFNSSPGIINNSPFSNNFLFNGKI